MKATQNSELFFIMLILNESGMTVPYF